MLFAGTQMHLITFVFVCLEVLIFFYLTIHLFARPDDRVSSLDVFLIGLLIVYNATGGLLPDPALPGSFFVQNSIAYGTGFITPCYFPYYVYKGFGLEKMRFHAFRGVFYFLTGPYLLFIAIFGITGQLEVAKNVLALPVVYAVWVIVSLVKAVQDKYKNDYPGRMTRLEICFMFLSLSPWVGLPVIDYFSLGQAVEVSVTNTGFLFLLILHIRRNIEQFKVDRRRLIQSELLLKNWNEQLQIEIDKRTKEIEISTREQRIGDNCTRYRFTSRETEIARLLCQGRSNAQMAEVLFISERTVAKHLQNMFEKAGVSSRVELIQILGA